MLWNHLSKFISDFEGQNSVNADEVFTADGGVKYVLTVRRLKTGNFTRILTDGRNNFLQSVVESGISKNTQRCAVRKTCDCKALGIRRGYNLRYKVFSYIE